LTCGVHYNTAIREDGPAAGWSFSRAAQGEIAGDGHGGDADSADDHGQIQPGAVGVAGGHAERAMGAASGGDGLGEAGLGAGPCASRPLRLEHLARDGDKHHRPFGKENFR
jgi:hypothetical protein